MAEDKNKDPLQDLTGKFLSKMLMSMFSHKNNDITLTLDNLELKLPISEHPVKLTGKIVLSFGVKKGKD